MLWIINNSNLASPKKGVIFWTNLDNMAKQLILVLSWHHKKFFENLEIMRKWRQGLDKIENELRRQ